MFNRSVCLLMGVVCLNVSAFSHIVSAASKEKAPVECTDHENYDLRDCEVATGLIKWKKTQNDLPDGKRTTSAAVGGSVLVENATGLRFGIRKIKNLPMKKDDTGILVQLNAKEPLMYSIDPYGDCPFSSGIEILKNVPEFTFLVRMCVGVKAPVHFKPSKYDDSSHYYYIFDKKNKLLIEITHGVHQKYLPTITYKSELYSFRWKYYDVDSRSSLIRDDFKLTTKTSNNVICVDSSEDEGCDNFISYKSLPPHQYKIIK